MIRSNFFGAGMWTFRRRSYQLRWDISSADNIRLKRNHQFPLSADSGGRLFRGKSSTVEDYSAEKVPQWKTISRKCSTVEHYSVEKFQSGSLFCGKIPQWKTISRKFSTLEDYFTNMFHCRKLFRGKVPQWKTIPRKNSTVEDYFAEMFHGGPNWVASVKVRRWNDQSRAEQVTIVPISNFHRSTIRRKSTGSSANRLKLREIGQFWRVGHVGSL